MISVFARSAPSPRSVSSHSLAVAMLALGFSGCDAAKQLVSGSDAGESSSGGGGSLFSGDFEGEITMSMKPRTKGESSTLVFGIKKPKFRIDMVGNNVAPDNPALAGGASLLVDPSEKKGWALSPQRKTAMVFDFEAVKKMTQSMTESLGGAPHVPTKPPNMPTIDKTGKKESVAGYRCEIWNLRLDNGSRSEVCAAEGITWFDVSDLGWSSPAISAVAALTHANRFPLRVVTFDTKGEEEMRMQAEKIDKKKLDDARFSVPADYQVMDLAAMMRGLQNLPALGIPKGGTPGSLPPGFPSKSRHP